MNVLIASLSWSRPTTYQLPSCVSSEYGSRVRSRFWSRAIDQYSNLTVRCFEIAVSSLLSRPASSGE